MRQKIVLLFVIIISSVSIFAQTKASTIDTVNIYKSKAGVPFRFYMKHWFDDYGCGNTILARIKKLNKQDSIVVFDIVPYYFKVYNRNNRIIFSGQRGYDALLIGDIKYFYKSGHVKRIIHWKSSGLGRDTLEEGAYMFDGPLITQKTYYRRNTNLKKRIEYKIKTNSLIPFNYDYVKQKIFYNRKNIISKTRNVILKKYKE